MTTKYLFLDESSQINDRWYDKLDGLNSEHNWKITWDQLQFAGVRGAEISAS